MKNLAPARRHTGRGVDWGHEGGQGRAGQGRVRQVKYGTVHITVISRYSVLWVAHVIRSSVVGEEKTAKERMELGQGRAGAVLATPDYAELEIPCEVRGSAYSKVRTSSYTFVHTKAERER